MTSPDNPGTTLVFLAAVGNANLSAVTHHVEELLLNSASQLRANSAGAPAEQPGHGHQMASAKRVAHGRNTSCPAPTSPVILSSPPLYSRMLSTRRRIQAEPDHRARKALVSRPVTVARHGRSDLRKTSFRRQYAWDARPCRP
ncbi:MAG: hypothetical protein ACRD0Z_15425 [Acidimicrobiales bacterium]